jgi:hypothetical protein
MPWASISWSSGKVADKPNEIANRPGDCGDRSKREVGAAHYQRQLLKSRIVSWYFAKKCVEAAAIPNMAHFGVRQVVRDGFLLCGHRQNLIRRHVEEIGIRIVRSEGRNVRDRSAAVANGRCYFHCCQLAFAPPGHGRSPGFAR